MVSLAYRHRAIPIAWTWVKQVRGHSSTRQQLALLKYVKGLISKKAAVFLVGDSEFGSISVLKQLDQWRWWYVLRQKRRTCLSFDEHVACSITITYLQAKHEIAHLHCTERTICQTNGVQVSSGFGLLATPPKSGGAMTEYCLELVVRLAHLAIFDERLVDLLGK